MDENIPSCYKENEWKKIKNQFNKDFKMYNKHIKSFREIINEILEGETQSTFVMKTELSPNMFSRIRTQIDKENPPQRSTIMSVAVGYNLDYQLTSALLDSIGLAFILSNPRDYAYQFLLTNCRGKSINECNEILEALGVEEKYWLGFHARQTRTNKK